jgi:CheY-like chemotaxis protein
METASDGKEAVKRFIASPKSLVVMDIAMPGMSGIEAFHAIRTFCEEKKIDVPSMIFTTGYEAGPELQEIIRGDPRHCCLRKPFSIDDLVQVAGRYLND